MGNAASIPPWQQPLTCPPPPTKTTIHTANSGHRSHVLTPSTQLQLFTKTIIIMDAYRNLTIPSLTFFIWNLMVARTVSTLLWRLSPAFTRVGNLPALVRPGPNRRGICVRKKKSRHNGQGRRQKRVIEATQKISPRRGKHVSCTGTVPAAPHTPAFWAARGHKSSQKRVVCRDETIGRLPAFNHQ